jgi:hypothetical protein
MDWEVLRSVAQNDGFLRNSRLGRSGHVSLVAEETDKAGKAETRAKLNGSQQLLARRINRSHVISE